MNRWEIDLRPVMLLVALGLDAASRAVVRSGPRLDPVALTKPAGGLVPGGVLVGCGPNRPADLLRSAGLDPTSDPTATLLAGRPLRERIPT